MRDFVRPFDERQRRVQHEIQNCAMGGCGLSRCEWVGGLFLGGSQGPSATTDYVPSCPLNLPRCDCRLTLPRQHLFGSCCKCRHVFPSRSSGGSHSAAPIKPLRLIQSSPPRALIKRALRRCGFRKPSLNKSQQIHRRLCQLGSPPQRVKRIFVSRSRAPENDRTCKPVASIYLEE
jgi:hypothetical protein